MKFNALPLDGVFEVVIEPIGDERGFFGRAFCQKEFAAQGLETVFVQANNSLSRISGTLRGLHFQRGIHAEAKLIRVIRGAMFDVLVDLRPDSPTFLKHVTLQVTAERRNAIYVPRGFANGIMTLEPDTELFYLSTNFYCPSDERGLRWNDPTLGISWPRDPVVISDKDSRHPDFDRAYHLE